MTSKKIEVRCRKTGQAFQEHVLGDAFMALFYGNPAGLRFTSTLLVRKGVSALYGLYNDSHLSRTKISDFVRTFNLNLDECEKKVEEYTSFNDFFTRKLKPEARSIAAGANEVVSPGDGRLLVFPQIDNDTLSFVKWAPVQLSSLFGPHKDIAARYRNGACAVLRLCPVDYHRFHFPAGGVPSDTHVIPGLYHSVNPYALEQKIPVYCLNKRTVCELESDQFGRIAILEVGAMMVGSIVQTYQPGKNVNKGEEKGFFKFGGSTTILFFEPGRVIFDEDLLASSLLGQETLVRMGERIALTQTAATHS